MPSEEQRAAIFRSVTIAGMTGFAQNNAEKNGFFLETGVCLIGQKFWLFAFGQG